MVQNVKHRSNKSFEQLFFCSEDVDEGKCKPECVKWKQIMETSLPAIARFYYKFQSDPVTGKPYGCPGLDGEWDKGKGLGFSK